MSMESVSTTLEINGSRSHIEALLAGISADDPDTFDAKIIQNKEDFQLKIVVGNILNQMSKKEKDTKS